MARRATLISIFIVGMFIFGLYLSADTIYAARVCRYVSCPGHAGCIPAPGNRCQPGTCIECTETAPPPADRDERPAPTSPPPRPTATPVIACIDSDGGSIPNTYGEVTIKAPAPPQVLKDTCLTLQVTNNADGSSTSRWMNGTIGTHVGEKTCVNVATGIYSDSVLACQYGCTNGACNLTQPSPTPVIYCGVNQSCPSGYMCVQPPMPTCRPGLACKQIMPRMYCVPDTCTLRSKGDANCDQAVNDADYAIWKSAFQGIRYSANTHSADFNKDGSVTIVDFEIWRATRHK